MQPTSRVRNVVLASMLLLTGCAMADAGGANAALPNPQLDPTPAQTSKPQMAVLAGGCFWGLQEVFNHVRGVMHTTAGFSGGSADTAHYERVSAGGTGHAESVRIVYDPAKVSYGQLLKVYFQVTTNPTELNRQGPDTGTQYRSDIFYANPMQKQVATAYIAQLTKAQAYDAPIVTTVTPLHGFYPAADYHQDYARKNAHSMYIMINDAPKVKHLQQQLPKLYTSTEG